MQKLILAVLLMLVTSSAYAQVVTAPTKITFQQFDNDFSVLLGYRLEYFQCASITPGPPVICNGRAASPFQIGTQVPKTSVTVIVPSADPNIAPTRQALFGSLPNNGGLQSLPIGVGFVAALVAIGDQAAGATGEVRSSDSNPFYPKALKAPVPATNVQIQ